MRFLVPTGFEKIDIHIHVPTGAIAKDGPSAGVAMFMALVSLMTERTVHNDTAMTFCGTKWRAIEMKEHETRRKIIREWLKLPKDQRRTEEQVTAFARMAVQQNEFDRSRRDPYEKVIAWLLPRINRS
jgi:Lon protease (S16) C-terminal proteolytic domain